MFLEPSGEPIAEAIVTTRSSRTMFRIAFVLHAVVYAPAVMLLRLFRRDGRRGGRHPRVARP